MPFLAQYRSTPESLTDNGTGKVHRAPRKLPAVNEGKESHARNTVKAVVLMVSRISVTERRTPRWSGHPVISHSKAKWRGH